MTDPALSVVSMAAWFNDAAARIHPALRNLRECQPGFPSTTSGSGSVGGGGGPSKSITERLALSETSIDNDDAVRDLARIKQLARDLEPKVRELSDLASRWGYRTNGEYRPDAPGPRAAGDRESESNKQRWCSSHARAEITEPVGSTGRNGRCRWCDDFLRHHETLPPINILDARERGIRITEAIITSDVAPCNND
jgi:hypothetical protein